MREAAPTEQFWKVWRKSKDAVKAAGFSLRKYQDEWAVSFGLIAKTALCRSHPRNFVKMKQSMSNTFWRQSWPVT